MTVSFKPSGRRHQRASSPMSTDSNMSPAITHKRPRRHKQNHSGQQGYQSTDVFNDGKDQFKNKSCFPFPLPLKCPHRNLCVALCPQTLACLWTLAARCATLTIRQGGPHCLGWGLGRVGVDEEALGLTGPEKVRLSRRRARRRVKFHREEKETTKSDSTQVLDGWLSLLWSFSNTSLNPNPPYCLSELSLLQNLGMFFSIDVLLSRQVKLKGSRVLSYPAFSHVATRGPNMGRWWPLQDRWKRWISNQRPKLTFCSYLFSSMKMSL